MSEYPRVLFSFSLFWFLQRMHSEA